MSWKEVRIEIETFSKQAEDRIMSLDFSELSSEFPPELDNHNGKFIYVKRNVDYFDDYVGDMYSGPFFMMRVIVDALGSQGKAVMVLKATEWEDEFHSCIVYYYLGDEIRTRVFFDNDTGCYYFNDFLSALLDMSTDKLTEIYKEMNDGEDIETDEITDEIDRIVYERRGYLAFSIAGALGYSDLQNVKKNIIEAYNGPLVALLFNEIDEMKKSCSWRLGGQRRIRRGRVWSRPFFPAETRTHRQRPCSNAGWLCWTIPYPANCSEKSSKADESQTNASTLRAYASLSNGAAEATGLTLNLSAHNLRSSFVTTAIRHGKTEHRSTRVLCEYFRFCGNTVIIYCNAIG